MTNNNDFETIRPAEIPLTQPPENIGAKAASKLSQPWVVGVALLLSVLLALAVIFVLPELVKPITTLPAQTETEEPKSNSTSNVPANTQSPWQEAQLAKARRTTQDILAKLLERQQFLEKQSVRQWADQRYQQGLEAAANGDQEFRQRNFDAATASYNQALDIFLELEGLAKQTLEDTLAAGEQALIDGDAKSAQQQFELALAIQPGNTDATTGLARAATLPEVLTLIASATHEQEQQRLEQAEQLFLQALQLDAQHSEAKQGLATVRSAQLERDFIATLSRGYRELDQGQLASARQSFKQALSLKPDSSDAQTALSQVTTRQRRITLEQQLKIAHQREQEEDWRAAETLYSQVLGNDSSVVDARVGQIRSRTRAELDEQLQELIDKPLRLSSSSVFQEGQNALQQARQVEPKGPRLTHQIATLQTILIKATTPWPVEFVSDNTTQVTLYRVGKLGQFDSKVVKLKPGRYVASGSRKGYRDVRVEFIVNSSGDAGPVVVQCKDQI